MFQKASHISYRTRGLEDAIKLAYHAQTIIGPDNIQNDPVYQSLGETWLSFTEQQESSGSPSLTGKEAELLNTLILIYLEGQVERREHVQIRNELVPTEDNSDEDGDDSSIHEVEKLPLWERYKRACIECEYMVSHN